METKEKYTIKFLILISTVVGVDLLIKLIIINTVPIHGDVKIIEGVFSIIRIQTVKLAIGIGWASGYLVIDIIKLAIQLLILFLAIRIQKRNVYILYKYSTVMMLCGWIGYYLDRIFLSQGNSAYVQLDYIYFSFFRFVFNLSEMVSVIGGLLLLVSVIIKFGDLKIIFAKQESTVLK